MTKQPNSYDRPRQALLNAIANSFPPQTLKKLSLACGRNHAYLQQYIERGSPLILPEDIRHKLAKMLDIPHQTLMTADLENEIAKSPNRQKSDRMVSISFLDHPQHAGMRLQAWKISDHMLNDMGFIHLSGLVLVQSGDNAVNASVRLGDFAVVDQSDRDPLQAGLFAIDARDHIKLRFLEKPNPDDDIIFIRHSSQDEGGFTQMASSIKIIGRAFWKLCLI